MSVKELRGLRTDNHARAVDLALVAAAAGQPVLVVVPRRSQARTWTDFVLRAAPNLSTVIRATTWYRLAHDLVGKVRQPSDEASEVFNSAAEHLLVSGAPSVGPALVLAEHRQDLSTGEHSLAQALERTLHREPGRLNAGESFIVTVDEPTDVVGPIVDARCATVNVHHPSLEADAAVAVVQEWFSAGHALERLAVVLPRRNDALIAELGAAATRAGIALSVSGRRLGDHQLVLDCVNAVEATQDCDSQVSAANRVFSWWEQNARLLLGDPHATRLVGALHAAVLRTGDLSLAIETPLPAETGGVRVLALADAIDPAVDQRWLGLVIVECLEGVLPRQRLRNVERPVRHADNSGRSLAAADRQLLAAAVGALDPHGELIGIASPANGVLTSRFLDGWNRRDLSLVRRTCGPGVRPLPETVNPVPIFPSAKLRLSATQLTTFEDCSWRYAFEYGLGLRGAGGASASAGSLAHKVLEEFLRPDAVDASHPSTASTASTASTIADRSLERLMALLDQWWDASEFRYSAQALDYRRRAEQWLANWWETFREDAPHVARTEYRFEVPLRPRHEQAGEVADEARHVLVGSIDRVDVVDPLLPGSAPTTRVVDYKSGSPKSQNQVDDDLQLGVYHYAATHDPELKMLGRPQHLELHYLQDAQSRTRLKVLARTVTADLEHVTVERITDLAEAILAEGYEPNIDAMCAYCAFFRLCPTQREGRHVQ